MASPTAPDARHIGQPYTPDPKTEPGTQEITSRLTTDGTRYLPETYESTDGTRELPYPMIDPQTGRKRHLPNDWPIGDPRRENEPDTAPRR